MMPAVLEYGITIQGNTITYTSPTRVAGLANNYCQLGVSATTLGLVLIIQPYVTARGHLGLWGPHGKNLVEIPVESTFSSFALNYVEITPGLEPCTFTSRNPMDDMITVLNDLLFRSGLVAGSWANITDLLIDSPFPVHQTVQGTITRDENVFHSDIRWFVGAASIQILTIILILPAYWGAYRFLIERYCDIVEIITDFSALLV